MANLQNDMMLITSRELECLSLTAQGYTMKYTARKLEISPRTVELHLRNIKDRYGLTSKNQLVKLWHNYFN
jgi:DNA-binding CsgD family transcriptional regulator